MEHIKETHHDIDYVIFTGDSPAHDDWVQSTDKNLEHERVVLETITDNLPDIPLYITLGNHEGFPVNSFPTHQEVDTVISGDWLYGGALQYTWAASLDQQAKA